MNKNYFWIIGLGLLFYLLTGDGSEGLFLIFLLSFLEWKGLNYRTVTKG